MYYRALFGAAMLVACALSAHAQDDFGGNVASYVALVDQYNAAHAKMRIDGFCISACTEKLGIKKVCVEPYAQLGFHQASFPDGSYAWTGSTILEIEIGHFPRLLARVKPWLHQPNVTFMSGSEAHRLGVPFC